MSAVTGECRTCSASNQPIVQDDVECMEACDAGSLHDSEVRFQSSNIVLAYFYADTNTDGSIRDKIVTALHTSALKLGTCLNFKCYST